MPKKTRSNRRRAFTRRRKQRGGNGFRVKFGGKDANGTLRPRSETFVAPQIQWNSQPNSLYTVIMWDPDAPAASWIHLLVVNIQGSDLTQGQTLLSYTPPTPPSGTHRYYVSLFEQSNEISVQTPSERGKFNVNAFVSRYTLRKIGEAMIRVSG